MNTCPDCRIDVRGDSQHCPLCGGPLEPGPAPAPAPWPDIALRFDRGRIWRALALWSLVVVVGTLAALQVFPAFFGGLRFLVLGLASLWFVAVVAVLKRRNVAKSIVYVVAITSVVTAYSDYLDDWHGWSLTWAIPIICSAAIIVLLVAVRITRMNPGDYIVYWWMASLLSLSPGLFLALDWVPEPQLPSWISVGLGVLMLVTIQTLRGADVQHELGKRLDV